ncbi:MAG: tetratricopeptide repeat protein [Flavicella sp.]
MNVTTPNNALAVLPFQNMSGNIDDDFFTDGISEEVLNALSKIEGLMVVSRASSFTYKNTKKDINEIGIALGVKYIVEGSVRKYNNQIRISVQLIQAENRFQIWSETYDRELKNIFELQDEISLKVAESIRENFGHFEIKNHLVHKKTNSIQSYSSYLKGRCHQLKWNFNEMDEAIVNFEESIKHDPHFYLPYFGLVQCYGYQLSWGYIAKEKGIALAEENFARGYQLNENSEEAYFALANKYLWVDWNKEAAISNLKKALILNPNNSEFLETFAECYLSMGNFDQALHYIDRAITLSPLSANHYLNKGNILFYHNELEDALKYFGKAIEFDPSMELAKQWFAVCLIQKGDEKHLNKFLDNHPNLLEFHFFKPFFQAINKGKVLELNTLPEPKDHLLPWSVWLPLYGEKKEQAIAQLTSLVSQRVAQCINFQVDPFVKAIKNETVFAKLGEVEIKKLTEQPKMVKVKSKSLLSPSDQDLYLKKLHNFVQVEKGFLDRDLSLRGLASHMGLNANRLSWLINEVLKKSFNEYINGLRLAEFKNISLKQENQKLSILGLAYECGFNSKSAFNDFFKKAEGITPSQWIKNQN